jgi:hypothetical protein
MISDNRILLSRKGAILFQGDCSKWFSAGHQEAAT